MDIKDVSYFCLCDTTKNIFYELNYDQIDKQPIIGDFTDEVAMVNDLTRFCITKTTNTSVNIHIILLCKKDSNELFVREALDALVVCMDKILKGKWNTERVETKYDLLVSLINEFVFNGIILENIEQKLTQRLPKRPFESVGGIKVNKGLASVLNKAAKNLKNSFVSNK